MKNMIFGAAAGLLILTTACTSNDGPDNNEPINIELTRSEQDAVKAINDFSFDLMRATEKRFSKESPNYVISPQSAAWAIAMAANGAEPGSQTLKEMAGVLRLGNDLTLADVNDYSGKLINAICASGRSDIAIANAVHYNSTIGIQETFLKQLKTFYNTDSFADPSNETIDSWISGKTDNMITDFAKKNELSQYQFGILNTMWFSGFWEEEFNPENIEIESFRNMDGTVGSPMMMNGKVYCDRSTNEMCHFLRVKFKGNAFAINFILPAEGHDLRDVAEYLNENSWKSLSTITEQTLTSAPGTTVKVKIPRLNMKSDFNLTDVMTDMGMKRVFSNATELSRIARENIMLCKFLHTTAFELDEKGAKAAAVSYVPGTSASAGGSFFYLDEPFYFFITEESTGAILFLGRVSQL